MSVSAKKATEKSAKVDLEKLKDSFDSRFDTELVNDKLLEIENKFGLPKQIYVNDIGEIWTSKGDAVFKETSPTEIKKVIRTIAASGSRRQVFAADELSKLFITASCSCQGDCQCPPVGTPQLDEAQIIVLGDDVIPDLLNEPEMSALNLPTEDQDQVATMVFSTIIEEKQERLKDFATYAAPKIAAFLNGEFQNLNFADVGCGKIKVFFDSKLATDELTDEMFSEFLKEAAKGVNFIPFYNQLVSEFSSKISSELPDYFNIRNVVVGEVLEQMNVKKD